MGIIRHPLFRTNVSSITHSSGRTGLIVHHPLFRENLSPTLQDESDFATKHSLKLQPPQSNIQAGGQHSRIILSQAKLQKFPPKCPIHNEIFLSPALLSKLPKFPRNYLPIFPFPLTSLFSSPRFSHSSVTLQSTTLTLQMNDT